MADIALKVYDNGDHTALVWLPEPVGPIPDCRGFIVRKRRNGHDAVLHGSVGFTDADVYDPAKPWNFPLQRYLWWDYFVNLGDVVQYSVVPVVGPDKDHLAAAESLASPFSDPLTVRGQSSPHVASFFNKGIVAAQWVAKTLDAQPADAKISDLVATPGNSLRNKLAGLLRPEILSLVADARANGGQVFAALYELNDPELIDALASLGGACRLILANGADLPDENAAVRARLRSTTQVQVFDRLVGSGHFAHNKFVVFCDAAGQPQRVLTGSTNWTSSGLCTQANNALLIDDADVAADFLAAWNRLRAAGNQYPADLVAGNDVVATHAVDGARITPWFVKTSAGQDLTAARGLINAASEGILFLFFNPGRYQQDPAKRTLLQDILDRTRDATSPAFDPSLYVRGVVNQDIPMLTSDVADSSDTSASPSGSVSSPGPSAHPAQKPVALVEGHKAKATWLGHEVLVPANVKSQFHEWEKELLGASMVNVHSKVIVLDPFGAKPVVMTGSHNLGYKASHANDDNLVIVEGSAPLAIGYALNIIAIFQSYRWNEYVEQHRADPAAWHGPQDNSTWQIGHLRGEALHELKFWMG
jgi:phosphatidylserine/phosphatidylglycerophosphate/cardiolipin synthase-like enzyme